MLLGVARKALARDPKLLAFQRALFSLSLEFCDEGLRTPGPPNTADTSLFSAGPFSGVLSARKSLPPLAP